MLSVVSLDNLRHDICIVSVYIAIPIIAVLTWGLTYERVCILLQKLRIGLPVIKPVPPL